MGSITIKAPSNHQMGFSDLDSHIKFKKVDYFIKYSFITIYGLTHLPTHQKDLLLLFVLGTKIHRIQSD